MSRSRWNTIKQSKMFFIATFRKGATALLVSLIINCLLVMGIYYLYINRPEPDYYATNGITPPVQLRSMLTRNYSSTALLPPDPGEVEGNKPIPE